MVPVPVFAVFAALNAHLLESCRKRLADRLRGHEGRTIGERLENDLAAFQTPLAASRNTAWSAKSPFTLAEGGEWCPKGHAVAGTVAADAELRACTQQS